MSPTRTAKPPARPGAPSRSPPPRAPSGRAPPPPPPPPQAPPAGPYGEPGAGPYTWVPAYPPYTYQQGPGDWIPVRPKPWATFPPWLRQTFLIYLYGLVGALLLVGLLYVWNIFLPLGPGTLPRAAGNIAVLLVGWLWGVFGAWMLTYRPLVPGGALGMGTGVATIVFGTLAVWDLARSYDLTKIPWALFWLQVVAVAAVAVVRAYLRREYPAMHLPALAAVAVGGLMLAVSILLETPSATADTIDKLGQSGAGLAFPMAAAGALFLMPNRPRLNLTRRLAYAGFVELAVFLCVKPWIDNSDMVKRMNVAMIAIAIILGLIALTFFLIDYMDLRRDRKAGGEPEPSG